MENEITETYSFHTEDYINGRRKDDGKTLREVIKDFERDFHHRHSTEYALNLYANSFTMHMLEKSCGAAPFLSYGMDLTKGHAFDAEQDPRINRVIEGHSSHIFVYGIDSAYMEMPDGNVAIDEEKGIYPLTLLIDNTMSNGIIRLATPTLDDADEEEEVLVDSPKFEYV